MGCDVHCMGYLIPIPEIKIYKNSIYTGAIFVFILTNFINTNIYP